MRSRKYILIALACAVMALGWYWWTYISYSGEVSRFEARVRQSVNPDQLQEWAVNFLQTDSSSDIHVFPAYIESLSGRHHWGVVCPRTYVSIFWGGGLGGHWGLHIGSTNFVESGHKIWRPGIYFWRDNE